MLIHLREPPGPRRPRADQREQDDEAKHERADIAPERHPGGRWRGRALALPRRLHQRAAHAASGDRADAVEPNPPVRARHLPQENESKDERRDGERERPAPGQNEFVVDVRFGVVADDRERQAEGDEPRSRRVAERRNELRRGCDGGRDLRGLRGRAHVFRPSRLPACRECRKA